MSGTRLGDRILALGRNAGSRRLCRKEIPMKRTPDLSCARGACGRPRVPARTKPAPRSARPTSRSRGRQSGASCPAPRPSRWLVQPGDVILSYNDEPAATIEELLQLQFEAVTAPDQVPMTVLRGDAELKLDAVARRAGRAAGRRALPGQRWRSRSRTCSATTA